MQHWLKHMDDRAAQDMIDQRKFRDALGKFATGVAVVTALRADGSKLGITINSFSSVSLMPPLVLWSIDKASAHFETFVNADRYNIHVLAAGQEDASRHFAGPFADQFEDVSHTLDGHGLPVLDHCLARFACVSFKRIDAGDHIVLIGKVEDFDSQDGGALTYFSSRYATLQ